MFSFSQAILGASVDVLTLDGMVTMKIPPGSQPDALLVLKSKGVKDVNNARRRGNQYVRLKLKIPTTLTPRQKELIQEFEKAATDTTQGGTKASEQPECRETFNINQAWQRLKAFMGTDDKTKKDDQSSSDEKTKAKI